jgi:UDP-glucose 4-epimerase
MKILITGAGGNLGRVLAPALNERGYTPILMDYRKIDTPFSFIQGDITDSKMVEKAVQGVDVIVHAAALHGIHLPKYTDSQFWDLNVTGTHNLYQAAVKNGVSKVIFCSTMGVYGKSIQSDSDSYLSVTEDFSLEPQDIYGLSKKIGEEMSSHYLRKYGIRTISMRLGMFVPEEFVHYGFRLLKGGVDDRDVAQAFILAIENEEIENDAFNIMSKVPFTKEDERELIIYPRQVIEKYYPGSNDIFVENNINVEEIMKIWGKTLWLIDKAENQLGYSPLYNFGEFLNALKNGNKEHYPFSDYPWWGV